MSDSTHVAATTPTSEASGAIVTISNTQYIDQNLDSIFPTIISLLPDASKGRFFYRAGVLCEIIGDGSSFPTFKFTTTNLSQRKIGVAINEIWEAKLKNTYKDQGDLQDEKDRILESSYERVDNPILLLICLIQTVFCQEGRDLQPVAEWDDVIRAIVERDTSNLASSASTWYAWVEELCNSPRLVGDLRVAEMSAHHRRSRLYGDGVRRTMKQVNALPATPPRSPMTRFRQILKGRVVAIRDTM